MRSRFLVKPFETPDQTLGTLDTDAVAKLIAATADVALIIDRDGVVVDLAFHDQQLGTELTGSAQWIGMPWIETVTPESRAKVTALLAEAVGTVVPRWRHINHPASNGSMPILYTAVQVGDGRVVAVGRDLKPLASLQQRLVEAQQSMERDYSRLRHVEMRYRLLFQMSLEPFLIIDGTSLRIAEANPAATRLLGQSAAQITGRPLSEAFAAESVQAISALLSVIRATGRADDVRARLADSEFEFDVSASLFRQDSAQFFLVRLSPVQTAAAQVPKIKWKLLKLVESAPDGFVVTNAEGRILTVNSAFLEIAQLSAPEQAEGEMLERWVGQTAVDLNVLITNLRQRGSVRLFGSVLRGEHGASTAVEISAVSVMNSERECFGFSIRNIGRRLKSASPSPALTRSVEQLTELVGRVSLKALVRETTDIIERLSIETALEMTGDNRASAAEMLGLSRQSLYVKLRRYGLAEFAAAGREGN
jgi:transcriptional regulator PpsR